MEPTFTNDRAMAMAWSSSLLRRAEAGTDTPLTLPSTGGSTAARSTDGVAVVRLLLPPKEAHTILLELHMDCNGMHTHVRHQSVGAKQACACGATYLSHQ